MDRDADAPAFQNPGETVADYFGVATAFSSSRPLVMVETCHLYIDPACPFCCFPMRFKLGCRLGWSCAFYIRLAVFQPTCGGHNSPTTRPSFSHIAFYCFFESNISCNVEYHNSFWIHKPPRYLASKITQVLQNLCCI